MAEGCSGKQLLVFTSRVKVWYLLFDLHKLVKKPCLCRCLRFSHYNYHGQSEDIGIIG